MIKKYVILCCFLIASASTFAQGGSSEVEQYVTKLLKDSVAVLDDHTLDSNTRYSKIKHMLAENLDIIWMARFTLGRNLKIIPKKDVERFIAAYSNYIVSTYSKGFMEYKGQKAEIKSFDNLGNGFFIVKTHIIGHVDQQPIHVDYLARRVGDTYKIRDIITEGISLVNSQRSEYASTIENSGINQLIMLLEKHLAPQE